MLIMILLFLLFIGFWLGQAQDCLESCTDFLTETFDLRLEDETEQDLRFTVDDMELTVGELSYLITVDGIHLNA